MKRDDMAFQYADDSLRYTKRQVAGIIAGSIGLVIFFTVILLALSVVVPVQ